MRFMAMAAILFLAACVSTVSTVQEPPKPATVAALIAADTADWADQARSAGVASPTEPVRFVHPPVVFFEEGRVLPAQDMADLKEAVAILNAVLPASHRIRIDNTGGERNLHRTGMPKDGAIFVDFLPREQWPQPIREQFSAWSDVVGVGIPIQPIGKPIHRVESGFVLVDAERIRKRGRPVVKTLLHEFLHVLGRRHAEWRFDTIMRTNAPSRPPSYLYPLDIAALKAVYGESR